MTRTTVYISSLIITVACSAPNFEDSIQSVSISSLRNIETNNRSVLITNNIIIEGSVTANDEYGEFYNTLIIEDEGAAVKILCDAKNNYRQYSFGNIITISCNGLYLSNRYGAITLGAQPTGEYTLDYIPQSQIGKYLKVWHTPTILKSPQTITINKLTPLNAFQYIQLDNIALSNTDGVTTFCKRDPDTGRTITTEHIATDKKGNEIKLRVNRLCQYADRPLPSGTCTIQGIVEYFNKEYSLTITNASYIKK